MGKKLEYADAIPRTPIRATVGDATQLEKSSNFTISESGSKEIERLRNVCLKNGEILQKLVEQLAPITELQSSNANAPSEVCQVGSDTSTILLVALTELMSVRDALLTEAKPTDLAVESLKGLNTTGELAANRGTNPNSAVPKQLAHAIRAPQANNEPIDASQSRPATGILPNHSAISALSSSVSENGSGTPKSPTSPPVSRSLNVSAQAAKRTTASPLKLSLEDILNDGTEFANVGGPSNRIGIADSAHSWMFGEPTGGNQSPKKSPLFGGGGVGAKMRLNGSNTSTYPSNVTQPLAMRKDISSQSLSIPITPTPDLFNDGTDNEIQDRWPEVATNVGIPRKRNEACSPKISEGAMFSGDHGPKSLATKNDFDEQSGSNLDDQTTKEKDFLFDNNVNFGHNKLEAVNYIDESEIPPSAVSSNGELDRLSGNVWL